jgi:uroporphyrinogen-III synthase
VQLHGEPLPELVSTLTAAGAEMIEVPVYRWVPPEDVAPLHRLLRATAAREVDALAFTSAPAATSFLRAAERTGLSQPIRSALSGPVLAFCVGPVTAAPLERAGVPIIVPDRSRLGALVRQIVHELPARSEQRVTVAGHLLTLSGRRVLVDDRPIPLGAAARGLLRLLADRPGEVVPRSVLREHLPGESAGEHAVDVAIARLRAQLGDARIVETVIKRGYRLRSGVPESPADEDSTVMP